MPAPVNLRRNPKAEPVAEPWADPRLDEGLRQFNEGHHFHAHETWEGLWMGLEGGEKLFVQGLIVSAALLHQYGRRIPAGVVGHWDNAQDRLGPHRPAKWGVDVDGLLRNLAPYAEAADRGDWSLRPADVQIRREKA